MTRIAVLLMTIVLVTGCAYFDLPERTPRFPPTDEQIRNADYGKPISQEEAEKIAEENIGKTLKDPISAQYSWQPVKRGWVHVPPTNQTKKHRFGYIIEGTVNAKNSYGGYTGAKLYRLFLHNGKMMRMDVQGRLPGIERELMIPTYCYDTPGLR